MPKPRAGTVTNDLAKTIAARNQVLIDFKNETALIHLGIGKASFTGAQIRENFVAVFEAIRAAKPPKTAGEYLRSASLTSTMGPGIKVDRDSVK